MSKQVQSEVVNDCVGNLNIEYNHYFTVDSWEEECHGIHQFEDIDTVKVEIIRVCVLYNDLEIDITNRLKKEEIKDLECELMP
jgi:hypothetical protein